MESRAPCGDVTARVGRRRAAMGQLALTLGILMVAAAAAVAIHRRGDVVSDERRYAGATRLEGSIEPVASAFNGMRQRPRLLAVLSPTSPLGLEGVAAIREEMRERGAALGVLVVWMEALPFDITRNPARRVVLLRDHPGAAQFYDSTQVVGRAVGERVGWPAGSVAWDLYLLFDREAVWEGSPPAPAAWFHHRVEGEPQRYRAGVELARALRTAIDEMLAADSRDPVELGGVSPRGRCRFAAGEVVGTLSCGTARASSPARLRRSPARSLSPVGRRQSSGPAASPRRAPDETRARLRPVAPVGR